MKILIIGFKKALTELKLFYFTSFIVALLVIIPISNFLLEGVKYIISGNFSLGLAGGDEVLGCLVGSEMCIRDSIVIIPISNFLLEGAQYVLGGNFSLGIAGGEEVLGLSLIHI